MDGSMVHFDQVQLEKVISESSDRNIIQQWIYLMILIRVYVLDAYLSIPHNTSKMMHSTLN